MCTCGTNPPKIGYPQKRKNERRQPDTGLKGQPSTASPADLLQHAQSHVHEPRCAAGQRQRLGQHLRRALGQARVFIFLQKMKNTLSGWGEVGFPSRVPPAPAPATPTAADSGTSSAKWWSSFRRELPSAGSRTSPRGGVTSGESWGDTHTTRSLTRHGFDQHQGAST